MSSRIFNLSCAIIISFIYGTTFIVQDIEINHAGPLTFTLERLLLTFNLAIFLYFDLKKIKLYDCKKVQG